MYVNDERERERERKRLLSKEINFFKKLFSTSTTRKTKAQKLSAKTIATPTLATGYGPLSIKEFGEALKISLQQEYPPIAELRVVVRHEQDVEVLQKVLQ